MIYNLFCKGEILSNTLSDIDQILKCAGTRE